MEARCGDAAKRERTRLARLYSRHFGAQIGIGRRIGAAGLELAREIVAEALFDLRCGLFIERFQALQRGLGALAVNKLVGWGVDRRLRFHVHPVPARRFAPFDMRPSLSEPVPPTEFKADGRSRP
jgi:hypothetical protein